MAIIYTVAYKCQRTKDQLLHYAVPDLVVQIVQELSTNDKLAYHATRLLKVLSVCPNNKVFFFFFENQSKIIKARIVEAGGIVSLGALIESNLNPTNMENRTAKAKSTNTIHALFTLRNLSDEAARQPSNDNYKVLAVLIHLVERNDLVKRNLSCEILYNLICRNYQNKGM